MSISDENAMAVCPLTLKESDLRYGECITLDVYAEQYGVCSEKKSFVVCYHGKTC